MCWNIYLLTGKLSGNLVFSSFTARLGWFTIDYDYQIEKKKFFFLIVDFSNFIRNPVYDYGNKLPTVIALPSIRFVRNSFSLQPQVVLDFINLFIRCSYKTWQIFLEVYALNSKFFWGYERLFNDTKKVWSIFSAPVCYFRFLGSFCASLV